MEHEIKTELKNELKREILFDKMGQVIEKQDLEIKQVKTENAQLKAKIIELETECHDTVTQCQEHIDAIENQNDILEEQIEELKARVLTEDELLFYYGSKADLILSEAYENNMSLLTIDYLKTNKFPDTLLEKLAQTSDSVATSNFVLTKTYNLNYKLIKK